MCGYTSAGEFRPPSVQASSSGSAPTSSGGAAQDKQCPENPNCIVGLDNGWIAKLTVEYLLRKRVGEDPTEVTELLNISIYISIEGDLIYFRSKRRKL
tara:strand:+ start:321 stop:614 length:294 start_codon:yes stop_codon:yes gene_type:complete